MSATTDGLLVNVDKLDLSGPICQRFQGLVDRVAPGTGMTEIKHIIAQAVAAKTRLQLTGLVVENEAPVVAKGGVKIPLDIAEGDEGREKWLMSPEGQNDYMLNLFTNRFPRQKIRRPSLMSMREMLINDWDLQTVDTEVRLNMEYDHKRRLVNPRMIRIEANGVGHLACDTVPWETVEEGELARVLFDEWRQGRTNAAGEILRAGHCLKTLDDWRDWQAFYTLRTGNRKRMRRRALDDARDSGPCSATSGEDPPRALTRGTTGVMYATARSADVGIAKRMFMAAYVHRVWGLRNVDLSQSQLAEWLTQAGFPAKPYDVKNAGRTQLHEHVLSPTPEVLVFLAIVKARFPELEVARFLVPVEESATVGA